MSTMPKLKKLGGALFKKYVKSYQVWGAFTFQTCWTPCPLPLPLPLPGSSSSSPFHVNFCQIDSEVRSTQDQKKNNNNNNQTWVYHPIPCFWTASCTKGIARGTISWFISIGLVHDSFRDLPISLKSPIKNL